MLLCAPTEREHQELRTAAGRMPRCYPSTASFNPKMRNYLRIEQAVKPKSTEGEPYGLLSGRLVGWEGQRWNHWPGEWGSGGPEWPWVIQTVGRQSAENPRRPGWCELVRTFNWLMSKLVASGGVKPGVEWPAAA